MSETRRQRILVVDDERIIADTLAAILDQHGYDATVAYDGESALKIVRVFKPHIIISDVVMPGLSGAEMAVRASRLLPSCKILLFSGQSTTADLLQDASGKGYTFELLPKPLPPSELLAKLRELCEEPAA